MTISIVNCCEFDALYIVQCDHCYELGTLSRNNLVRLVKVFVLFFFLILLPFLVNKDEYV